MTDLSDGPTPDQRPRPTPRPHAGATPRPGPRARVAGSRRDRDAVATTEAPRPTSAARPTPAPRPRSVSRAMPARPAGVATARPRTGSRRRMSVLAAVLAVLSLLTAGAGGFLIWERLHPPYVTASVFDAARKGVEALYAFDYKDAKGSVARKLAVLTGDLRAQYQKDLSQGGIVDTYQQVSATTSYDVLNVGLQQIDDAQNTATVVVFGDYVVRSVNSGRQSPPQGSECRVTTAGAQSCTQTVQVHLIKVDGVWKINDLTLLTTS